MSVFGILNLFYLRNAFAFLLLPAHFRLLVLEGKTKGSGAINEIDAVAGSFAGVRLEWH